MMLAPLAAILLQLETVTAASADPSHFGPFTLAETQVNPPGLGLPAIELKLQFRTIDGRTKVSLIDNGSILSIEMSSDRCGGGTAFLSYDGRVGEPRLFTKMVDVASSFRSDCGIDPERARLQLSELRQSRGSFTAGVQAMKARAEALFGGWRRRCRAPDMRPGPEELVFPLPSPHDPCRGGTF